MEATHIKDNLNRITEQIEAVCKRTGQNPAAIQIVAASKFRSIECLRMLAEDGRIAAFGENRVQEWQSKYDPALTWDMIGRLQTNKVKYLVGKVRLIQSVDRMSLAEEINRIAAMRGVRQNVLIEINSGEEEAKGGIVAEAAGEFWQQLQTLPALQTAGLMAVAPLGIERAELKKLFEKVRRAYEEIAARDARCKILSMGMSHDLELALECGSNMVRPGRLLFDPAQVL